jgi:primosomal protein N' (replication factor Y)
VPDYGFCDVSLPVPLDQLFTYSLPETLRHRVQPGSRVLAPFGGRKLTGVVLRVHDDPPQSAARELLRLLDEEPVLDETLLCLGQWIASYYCAPLGEVLRAMTPLSGDVRRGKVWALTTSGRDAARQLHLSSADPEDPSLLILRMLETRELSAAYLMKKIPRAVTVLRSLEKKGLVTAEEIAVERDPLSASAARLRVEFLGREEGKLPKAQREVLAFLELHPGSHNLAEVELAVKNASPAARALARKKMLRLTLEAVTPTAIPFRAPHLLNVYQQAAFDQMYSALRVAKFHTFLLQGVTGSGKTEVYLKAIEATLTLGRSALMLVP